MSVGRFDIEIEQGVDLRLTFKFKDNLDNYISLTGYNAILTARYSRLDGDLAFVATIDNTKLVVESDTSLVLTLSELDTNKLESKSCVYDLDLIDASGNSSRWLRGNVIINSQVVKGV